jgi:hypothetical protein
MGIAESIMESAISRSARLALRCAEENPDEVVAALDGKTEAVICELEAQHKQNRAVDR